MFKQSILSNALNALVEAVNAVVEYLKLKLMAHICRDEDFAYRRCRQHHAMSRSMNASFRELPFRRQVLFILNNDRFRGAGQK